MENEDALLDSLIAAELAALVALRHDLHAHPQVAFRETYAAELIQSELRQLGIPLVAGIAQTGVVAWITPEQPQAATRDAVALRCDMDALAIREETGLPHASANEGVMHACGHDGHMAILLGAARVLAKMRSQLPCPVKLIFQPAEELLGGGREMVEAGVLEARVGEHRVGRIFGLHGWPSLELGQMATRSGPLFGSMDVFRMKIVGAGGHGAAPHRCVDPIVAAATIVTALQTIVARNTDPTSSAVVSVSQMHAGSADNVIPRSATLSGTIRAIDESTRLKIHRRIDELAVLVAQGLQCRADVEIEIGYPVTVNNADATRRVVEIGRSVLGQQSVTLLEDPALVSEDFAFYGQRVPACFFLLGVRPPDAADYPALHTRRFDFNDDAIAIGVRLMCRLAMQ